MSIVCGQVWPALCIIDIEEGKQTMILIILYLSITLIGYAIGTNIRKKGKKIGSIGRVQMISIIILIFIMGSRIGADKKVISGLASTGAEAVILTVFAAAGSLAAVFVARRFMGIDRKGVRQ